MLVLFHFHFGKYKILKIVQEIRNFETKIIHRMHSWFICKYKQGEWALLFVLFWWRCKMIRISIWLIGQKWFIMYSLKRIETNFQLFFFFLFSFLGQFNETYENIVFYYWFFKPHIHKMLPFEMVNEKKISLRHVCPLPVLIITKNFSCITLIISRPLAKNTRIT